MHRRSITPTMRCIWCKKIRVYPSWVDEKRFFVGVYDDIICPKCIDKRFREVEEKAKIVFLPIGHD